MKKNLPQVVIVGRANVGKSTLFNRLIEKNKALVSSVAGTTRDRNIDVVSWRDRQFTIIDTGGLDINQKTAGEIEKQTIGQVEKAITAADLILFIIDAKDGATISDKLLTKILIKRGLKEKIILVGNKADSLRLRQATSEIYKLGLGEPLFISAANGSGVGDLLDEIMKKLPPAADKLPPAADKLPAIKIAIVGRPNVGKSLLVNSILGEERVIVTDTPHTTRESHDTELEYQNNKFIIIDTAGLRKKGKVLAGSLEKKSVDKTLTDIGKADMVLLVVEAQKKIEAQDKKISQAILAAGQPVIIVANKWDLIPDKDTGTINKYIDYYRQQLAYLWWAPLIFVSAKDHLRTKKILDLALEINEAKRKEISDSQLERFLKTKIKQHKPSRGKGLKNPYIFKITQESTNPPHFVIYVNDPKILHFSYIRFLQNNLRETFKLIGTPIQTEVKKWKENN